MKALLEILTGFAVQAVFASQENVHTWEKAELTFRARNAYTNAYTQAEIWVDLRGPGFRKRCYGFWDGGDVFRVRVLAIQPGKWTWRSGSQPSDPGLAGHRGTFTASDWSEADKAANETRRGFVRPTANGHAFEYADGTPFILLADTWYAAGTSRFRWDEQEHPLGPQAGFKDYVRLRKQQSFNCVAIIAAFPNWADDGQPWEIWMDKGANVGVRSAWVEQDDIANHRPRERWRAKNMENEGGRAFLFPGKVPGYEQVFPDVDRLNPEYFKFLDRKIDYLNAQGITPLIEVARRDATACWTKYYRWPESYSRYIQYVWSRYQANHCLFSPVHYDWVDMTASPRELNQAANLVIDRWGRPPFGTLVSCNSSISSLINFGEPEENHWLTFHQTGNRREHDYYWYLTEIFNSSPSRPALNGEPYYAGMADKRYTPYAFGAPGGTETDDLYVRSGIYGSFLSGGFGGHIYGAEGIWGADIEPGSSPFMWEAFVWNSANQMRHLKTFALSNGTRYRDLVPDANLVSPNKTPLVRGYVGWAYCARTPERDFFLAYFEKGCPAKSVVRGAVPGAVYQAEWFDAREGKWSRAGQGELKADVWGRIEAPEFPADNDWGLKLVKK